jgi:TatD DNase family protein
MLVDTHCHLDVPPLISRLPAVLAAAREAGVATCLIPGVSPDGWADIASLAAEYDGVYPAFGLHPMLAECYDDSILERLRTYAGEAVAIGEIGVDYMVDVARVKQQTAFRAQLQLAVEAGLPVMIHCRRAFQDLMAILREEGVQRIGGVMHAFSGSPETARECIGLGMYISVAGTVTYHNAVKPLEVVRSVPLERLLLETDAPDMTPEPYRGKPNEPAFLVETARKVAEIKGITVEELARVTTANAERLFRF